MKLDGYHRLDVDVMHAKAPSLNSRGSDVALEVVSAIAQNLS